MRTTPLPLVLVLSLIPATGCASDPAPTAAPEPAHVTPLLTQPLPDARPAEARMITVEYAPGGASPPHRHPGAIFAYVLEGAVECALDDGEVVKYGPGQCWYEKPNQLHRVSRNASTTRPAKLLVFFVTTPGSPALEPAH